jgi:hypothetical protein
VLGGNFLRLIAPRRRQPLAYIAPRPSREPLESEYRDPWLYHQVAR